MSTSVRSLFSVDSSNDTILVIWAIADSFVGYFMNRIMSPARRGSSPESGTSQRMYPLDAYSSSDSDV